MKTSVVGLVILAACGGGATSPKQVVSEFMAALETGNVDEAKGYLRDANACAHAGRETPEMCQEMSATVARALPRLSAKLPKGAITAVTSQLGGRPVDVWSVEIDHVPAADVMVQTTEGRAYVVKISLASDQVITDQ